MGFKKFVKRLGKKAKGVLKKVNPVAKMVLGGSDKGGDDPALEARSEAAAKQIKTVNRQAGSGQIEYQTEE